MLWERLKETEFETLGGGQRLDLRETAEPRQSRDMQSASRKGRADSNLSAMGRVQNAAPASSIYNRGPGSYIVGASVSLFVV